MQLELRVGQLLLKPLSLTCVPVATSAARTTVRMSPSTTLSTAQTAYVVVQPQVSLPPAA